MMGTLNETPLFDPVLDVQVERWVEYLTDHGAAVTIATPDDWTAVHTPSMVFAPPGPMLVDRVPDHLLLEHRKRPHPPVWWDRPAWTTLAGFRTGRRHQP